MPSASTPRRNGSHGSDTLTSRSSTWSPCTERAVTPRRAERASGRLAVHSQHPSRLPRRCRPARRRFSTQSPRTQRAPPARGAVPRQDPQERLSGVRRGDMSRFTPRPGGGPGLDRHPKRCARALPGPVSPAQGCRSAGPVLPPPARSQAARVNASRRAAASSAGQQREPPPPPPGKGQGAEGLPVARASRAGVQSWVLGTHFLYPVLPAPEADAGEGGDWESSVGGNRDTLRLALLPLRDVSAAHVSERCCSHRL